MKNLALVSPPVVVTRPAAWLAVAALALLPAVGCHESSAGGRGDAGAAGGRAAGNDASAGLGGANGGGGGGYDGPTLGVDGSGKVPIGMTQCSDGLDNDGDGRVDYGDPECVGPLDDDESSFATGIHGDNMDACKQDCFFDGNSGMGDDHCQWQLQCDPKSTNASCPYDSAYAAQHPTECSVSNSQSQACIDYCRRLVPNGCDCFGCCAIPGAPQPILLAATCTSAKFNDPTACPPCTQVTQCANPCERCEICLGKPTVPADCYPSGADGGYDAGYDGSAGDGGYPPPPVCSSGWAACGPGGIDPADCPTNTGCVTGCCIPIVP